MPVSFPNIMNKIKPGRISKQKTKGNPEEDKIKRSCTEEVISPG